MKCAKCKKIFDYLNSYNQRCHECKEITKENRRIRESLIPPDIIAEKKKISKENNLKKKIAENLIKYPNGSDTNDYVECKLCTLRSADLSTHVTHSHDLSIKEYTELYGSTKSINILKNMSGEKNPFFNHGGTLSPFSKNFIHYKSDEDISILATKSADSRKKNSNADTTLEYYISRGFSEEESKKLLAERQATFSLKKCIAKYGEEGTKVYEDRQIRWQNTLNSKSIEEKSKINSKRASFNFSSLWSDNPEHLEIDGYFYIISFQNSVKIGITSKDQIDKRYSGINKISGLNFNLFVKVSHIKHAFQIEQILLNKFRSNITRDKNTFYKQFGRYEIITDIDISYIMEEANLYISDKHLAATTFKTLKMYE